MQYGFYFDQTRCIGCNACSVSCKDWNQVNPGPVRWRDQRNYENGNSVFENLTMSCNHCENPACLTACGAGAISKSSKGIVIVDKTKCQGLKACIVACPFAAPHIADNNQEPTKRSEWKIAHPMQKCKYCHERVEDGGSPVCVAACPVRALDYGDIKDLQRKYPDAVRLNKGDFPYAYSNPMGRLDTNPSFFIKKRNKLTVTPFAGTNYKK